VRFSSAALALLQKYSWPGNIRELENAVVRAAAMCDGLIRIQDLPERIRNFQDAANATVQAGPKELPEKEEWPSLAEIEGRHVARVLAHTRGNKQAASRVLQVDRKTLDRMIKRHHISLEKEFLPKPNGFVSKPGHT
jgi:DNA-binding NtrC family response regulator